MLKFSYQVKKRAKDKGDYRIVKRGQVAEFSLRELARNIEQVKKQAKEMEANAKLQESLAENIRRANLDLVAYMKKLTPKKRFTLTMLAIQENNDLPFRGVVIIGKSREDTLKRIEKDHRWGNTEELWSLEADSFFNVERPRYKNEAEKYNYPVFETADEAFDAVLKFLV